MTQNFYFIIFILSQINVISYHRSSRQENIKYSYVYTEIYDRLVKNLNFLTMDIDFFYNWSQTREIKIFVFTKYKTFTLL